MSDYMVENQWKEHILNVNALAADLAPLVGGVVDPEDKHVIALGDLRIYIRAGYGAHKGRAEIGVHAPSVASQLNYQRAQWPKMTADAGRPVEKIAAEIKRRVIEPAAPVLADLKAQLANQLDQRSQIEAHAEAIRKAFPMVSVKFEDGQRTQAQVYGNAGGAYLSARLNPDGGLYPDRVGSIGPERTHALLAALFSPLA
jgi:hypothetical protein